MTEIDPNTREAIRLLGAYTAGRFDIWTLAGSAKASCRAHIMSAFNGKKTPQSASGVNAMTAALYDRLGVNRDQIIHFQDQEFNEKCRQITAADERDSMGNLAGNGYAPTPSR